MKVNLKNALVTVLCGVCLAGGMSGCARTQVTSAQDRQAFLGDPSQMPASEKAKLQAFQADNARRMQTPPVTLNK